MATTPQQGIMALPETDEATTPQLSLNESYSAAKEGLADADPQFSAMYDDAMAKAMPALMALSDEELEMLLQLVQYLQDHPEEYAKNVQELEQAGVVGKGDFPAEYDENFLAVFGAAVLEAQRTNDDTGAGIPAMQPPMQLAKGGIAEAARMVARHGRNGDTMLAHINKEEAALLKKHGGSGTLNPHTGLREYGWNPVKAAVSVVKGAGSAVSGAVKGVTSAVSSAIKSVGSAVKQVLASPLGKIVATVALAAFIGPAAFGLSGAAGVAAQMGLASAGITALSGGNLKDVVRAGTTGAVLGYGGAALGPAIGGSVGVTSAAGQAALGAGLTSAGLGAVTGKSIKDSVKDGLTSAAIAGAMTYANSEGVSRGTQGQDPSKVPVTDATGKPVMPGEAGTVKVDPVTGQVTTSGQAPAGPDPLGDFIAQNEAFRAAASTPVPAPVMPSAPAPAQGPAGPDPLGDFIAQNEAFRTAASTPVPNPEPSWWDKAKSMVSGDSAPTTDEIVGSKQYRELINKGISADKAFDMIKADYTPSLLAQYGAPVAAGLGATALLGGFKQETPQPSQESMDVYTGQATRDLMAAAPKDYYVQNLPGVQYDDKGAIVGSKPWTPRAATQTEVASSNYIPYSPAPVYQTPGNSIGSRQVAQPYNTASMYDFRPRYAAQGGFMETQGAFPANPLTMQSSPMMAMDSHRLPMNTPGVPMNTPMGFAEGGIASLSPAHFDMGGLASTIKGAIARLQPQLKEMFAPVKEGLADMKTYFQAPPTAGGGGTAPAASAVAAALQNAGYGAPAAAPALAPQVSAPQVSAPQATAPQVAPVQYTPVPYVVPNAPLTTADASELFAQRLYPSLYDADFQARLRQGARRPQQAAPAGIASLAVGGYPRRTGQISGPGTETSDDIPAMLSDGEFVMTAKAVKGMGGGSRRAGAKKMYALMHRLEKNAARG